MQLNWTWHPMCRAWQATSGDAIYAIGEWPHEDGVRKVFRLDQFWHDGEDAKFLGYFDALEEAKYAARNHDRNF